MVDHHGVASHVCANILWAHLSGDSREGHALVGPTGRQTGIPQQQCPSLLHCFQVQNGLPPFKVENIKDGDWLVLKGNNVKAANPRALVPSVLALQQRATEMVQSPKNKHMLKVVEALTEIYNAMYNNSCFLNLDMVVALEQNLAKLGRHYQWLSAQAHNAGITKWQTVPKFHYALGHLGNQAALITPRSVQGYA